VNEPHEAVCCDARADGALNLVAAESAPVRSASAELSRESPAATLDAYRRLPTLSLPRHHDVRTQDIAPKYLQKILLRTYEQAPENFEQLLGIPGVGAKTVRALALVSELVHGTPASTRDPARFAFAHGGKDGHPFPVDRATYERTIDFLHGALDRSRVDRSDKVAAFKRLAAFAADAPEPS
jgi:hypothetical protein